MGDYFDISVGGWMDQQRNVILTFLMAVLVWMVSQIPTLVELSSAGGNKLKPPAAFGFLSIHFLGGGGGGGVGGLCKFRFFSLLSEPCKILLQVFYHLYISDPF